LAEILEKAVAHIFFHHDFIFFFRVKMGSICANDHICSTFLCKKVLRGKVPGKWPEPKIFAILAIVRPFEDTGSNLQELKSSYFGRNP
tara:strand:+ start:1393 stop:1656 length:264 start_codon:yes stop_codon:yes gene_type:complete